MTKIIIIGGGASGLVAAIHAKTPDNEVIILEKNSICGKKILVTGNGKCNYFNDDFTIEHFRSSNLDILNQVITDNNKNKILNFFDSLGIIPKIKNGYYYPYSNQAITIKEALVLQVKLLNISIINNTPVENIEFLDNKFIITTNTEQIVCDKLILSTGSYAAPSTGSNGFSYKVLKQFKHNLIKPLPALTPLNCIGNYFKEWNGVRTDVIIKMLENNKITGVATGEIQLTNNGISGICTFQLSGRIIRSLNEGNIVKVQINFVPYISYNNISDIVKFLDTQDNKVINRTISELLDGMLNYKLVNLFLKKLKIDRNSIWKNIADSQKLQLAKCLCEYTLEIDKNYSSEKAQVCSGGVPLNEIDINTMESLKQKNLYLTGELLDVDGDCGGYNLGFAWLSGIIAGTSIKGDNNEN